jgi:hypothetical protein
VDFKELGDGPAVARQVWLSEMRAATTAAWLAEGVPIDESMSCVRLDSTPVDTEGNIRYWRCKRRTILWLGSTISSTSCKKEALVSLWLMPLLC